MRILVPRFLGLATSAMLLVFLMPSTSHAATSAPTTISSPARTTHTDTASVSYRSIVNSPSVAAAAASGETWAVCGAGTCTIALDDNSTGQLIAVLNGPPKLLLLQQLYKFCNAFGPVAVRAACSILAAAIVIAGAPYVAHQLSIEDTGYGVYITLSLTNTNKFSVTPQPAIPAPYITQVTTYTQGVFVYFKITYADPGNNAEGFGFVGINGSGWAQETHPFSSPSYGIVGPNSIAYPFNSGCGTAQQYDSYVQAWIYNTVGEQSPPVIIHLVCAAT
jgi:hypothetical protein